MKKVTLFFLALICLSSLICASQAAQVNFTPRASVAEEYNDNILLDRRDKKDDFITKVSAGFSVEVLAQERSLIISYDPAYSFYADNSDYDGFQHTALLSFENNFSRTTNFAFSNYFLYSKDPLADRDVTDDAGDIIVSGDDTRRNDRDVYWRNVSTARLKRSFGLNDLAYTQLTYAVLENDDPNEEDSQEISPSAGLVYWWNTWNGVEFDGGYTRGLYDQDTSSDFYQVQGRGRINHRYSQKFGVFGEYGHIYRNYDDSGTNSNDLLEQNYNVYAPSAGFFYDFGENLTASFGAGYYYQQISNADDEQGPFVNADINKLWQTSRWSARVRGSSGLDTSDFTAESLGLERYGQIELIPRYYFTRQLYADAGLRYRYSDYINNEDNRKDHRYNASIGMGYLPARWMTLELKYNFNKLDSINTLEDYEENRVLLSITLQPDVPWRWK